jgi:hypothetical protein
LIQPFDARGLYQDAVLGLEEFADEREGIALFHELVEHLISSGREAGEFVVFEPSFVQRAVNGVLFETLREQGGPGGRIRERRPLQAADFVLRALLVEGTRLDRIRGVTQDRLGELEAATVL